MFIFLLILLIFGFTACYFANTEFYIFVQSTVFGQKKIYLIDNVDLSTPSLEFIDPGTQLKYSFRNPRHKSDKILLGNDGTISNSYHSRNFVAWKYAKTVKS